MSKIEEKVIARIRERAETGKSKYGKTMEREDLSLHEWLVHLQEEMLDAAVYIEKLKTEIQTEIEEEAFKMFEEDDDRMNIIGQNGNDGLHYEIAEHMHNIARNNQGVEEEENSTQTSTNLYPGDIKVTYEKL